MKNHLIPGAPKLATSASQEDLPRDMIYKNGKSALLQIIQSS